MQAPAARDPSTSAAATAMMSMAVSSQVSPAQQHSKDHAPQAQWQPQLVQLRAAHGHASRALPGQHKLPGGFVGRLMDGRGNPTSISMEEAKLLASLQALDAHAGAAADAANTHQTPLAAAPVNQACTASAAPAAMGLGGRYATRLQQGHTGALAPAAKSASKPKMQSSAMGAAVPAEPGINNSLQQESLKASIARLDLKLQTLTAKFKGTPTLLGQMTARLQVTNF